MSGLSPPSAASAVWPRNDGSTASGPIPIGGTGATSSSTANNTNLPTYSSLGGGTIPPPVPRLPSTSFPTLGPTNSTTSNNYGTANTLLGNNTAPVNPVPNPVDTVQTPAYQRRLAQLEDDVAMRRTNVNRSTQ